jgi:hypothetical protein
MLEKILKTSFVLTTLSAFISTSYASNNASKQTLDLGKSLIDKVIFPKMTEDAPDWAKRIEFEWQLTEDSKPEYSVWTVQPLYQSFEKKHTFFTQARVNHEVVFGDKRTSSNLGLGYRSLFLDNKVLLGANSFFDKQWESGHARVGYGFEAKWANFDLFANYYDAISDEKIIDGATERALDGYDVELRSIVPYLPWLTVSGRSYEWDSKATIATPNTKGTTATLEARITPNITLEAGMDDNNNQDKSHFIQTRFKIADLGSKKSKKINFVDDKAFRLRDMSNHTLERVRRHDKIFIEKEQNGSIIIRRSN